MPTGTARSTRAPASACASTTSNSFAGRPPLGGLGIASYPGTLDHHRARNIEAAIQLIIDNVRRPGNDRRCRMDVNRVRGRVVVRH